MADSFEVDDLLVYLRVVVLRGPFGPGLEERKKLVRPASISAAS
jgi:hypothetical protein